MTLNRRGHLLVADDYIAVAAEPYATGPLLIYPDFPQLTHWPEAAAFTGAGPAQLPHLRQCAVVLRQTPVRRLRRPRNLDVLDDVAACIEADASSTLTG